jgi:hypothetical protein
LGFNVIYLLLFLVFLLGDCLFFFVFIHLNFSSLTCPSGHFLLHLFVIGFNSEPSGHSFIFFEPKVTPLSSSLGGSSLGGSSLGGSSLGGSSLGGSSLGGSSSSIKIILFNFVFFLHLKFSSLTCPSGHFLLNLFVIGFN